MLKKDITFIYMDSAERSAYQPIAEEAERRGYCVTFTDDKFAKCEIGFYCQHVNHPQFSKFSVIMLHDIIQQYSNWPDIWYREPWDKYDIGILPSDQWVHNWNQCSQFRYARPRKGLYKIGWPKADKVAKLKASAYRKDFYTKHGLDLNKKTILYAPAWENDGKQEDFVQSMLKLDVNIVIKQAAWNEKLYPQQVWNINEMYEMHKDLDRVTILPPVTNIFEAIAVSDILVSEESSTMCEATMMGVPAISVSDWLIPDVTPSRFPKCDYDFVFVTKKAELTSFVQEMLEHYEEYHTKTQEFSRVNFSNIGCASSLIMDIIDDCVAKAPVRHPVVPAQENKSVPLKRELARCVLMFKLELVNNYAVRYPLLNKLLSLFRKLKYPLKKSERTRTK